MNNKKYYFNVFLSEKYFELPNKHFTFLKQNYLFPHFPLIIFELISSVLILLYMT
jgi:hypothetical protein